jgi:choline-glycine betaine transporter
MNPLIIPLVAIVLVFMIPILAISQGLISQLVPLIYVLVCAGSIKWLMDVHHEHKIAELEKKKELEQIALEHLKTADQLLEDKSK